MTYRDAQYGFTPAKLARTGHYWMPLQPIDWDNVPLSCLESGLESVHVADSLGRDCKCEQLPYDSDSAWQRAIRWLIPSGIQRGERR